MLQNLPVVVTLGRHNRRTNLAQAYAVAPARAAEDYLVGGEGYRKGRTVKV